MRSAWKRRCFLSKAHLLVGKLLASKRSKVKHTNSRKGIAPDCLGDQNDSGNEVKNPYLPIQYYEITLEIVTVAL